MRGAWNGWGGWGKGMGRIGVLALAVTLLGVGVDRGVRQGVAGSGEPRGAPSGAPAFLAPEGAPQALQDGPPYNGKFTFVRIRYDVGDPGWGLRGLGGGRGRGGGWMREPPWAHDYPRAETNFAKIIQALTLVDTYTEGYSGRVLSLADPEIFKYPIANIIEVGYWNPTEVEVLNLRNWLLKGGFLVIDDTRQDRGFEFQNLQAQMARVLPDHEILLVPKDHPIYDSFFRITDPQALLPPYGGHVPIYLGIFEDNDPLRGRLMVMINFNTDLQEYWEFADAGYYPIDLSNEAFKLGVNYLIYALTH